MKKVIIVCGATGTGKTKLSIEIAKKMNGSIINCDTGQYYNFVKIGTAAPTEEEKSGIDHFLFNVENNPTRINSYDYAKKIENYCEEIIKDNKIPIIVGGSNFYIYSLLFNNKNNENENFKEKYFYEKKIYSDELKKKYYEELKDLDKKRAEKININDVYRVLRSINIISNNNGESIKEIEFNPKYNYKFINNIVLNEDKYKKAIKERINIMIKNGWIEEIKILKNEHKNECLEFLKKNFIGYSLIIDYLNNNENDIKKLKNDLFIKTTQYGKNQLKYIKKIKKESIDLLDWIDLDMEENFCNIDKIMEKI